MADDGQVLAEARDAAMCAAGSAAAAADSLLFRVAHWPNARHGLDDPTDVDRATVQHLLDMRDKLARIAGRIDRALPDVDERLLMTCADLPPIECVQTWPTGHHAAAGLCERVLRMFEIYRLDGDDPVDGLRWFNRNLDPWSQITVAIVTQMPAVQARILREYALMVKAAAPTPAAARVVVEAGGTYVETQVENQFVGGGATTATSKRGSGRPPKKQIDRKTRQRVEDAWDSGQYRGYQEVADKFCLQYDDVDRIIDARRKREHREE